MKYDILGFVIGAICLVLPLGIVIFAVAINVPRFARAWSLFTARPVGFSWRTAWQLAAVPAVDTQKGEGA